VPEESVESSNVQQSEERLDMTKTWPDGSHETAINKAGHVSRTDGYVAFTTWRHIRFK